MATCPDSPQCQGLSQRRLQVLTVIHNFDLKRSDGSTAAQRLFGRQFPNLFDYLVEHMGDLPQPRKLETDTAQNAYPCKVSRLKCVALSKPNLYHSCLPTDEFVSLL